MVLEWFMNGREAVEVSRGDESFGYALLEGGQFVPGEHDGLLDNEELPPDLIDYLTA